jgi:hypothetical protein
VTREPSLGAIFAWANERFNDQWPGLFAIGFAGSIVPLTRMVLEQGDAKALHPWVGLGIAALQELVLLLVTAAMVLLVAGPITTRASDTLREVIDDAPRLIVVKIVATLARWIPTLIVAYGIARIAGPHSVMLLVASVALLPLDFLSKIAFAGAVMERTGPFEALKRAYDRTIENGVAMAFVLALIFSIVDQLPPIVFLWVANLFFPPHPIAYVPHIPARDFPYPLPPMSLPGRFGSGIPWWFHGIILLAAMPFFAYVTSLYAAATLEFGGYDIAPRPRAEDSYAQTD